MKELKNFINEEDKDKGKAKPTLKPGEKQDDQRYVLLMEAYKRMRQHDSKKAQKIYDKAQRLTNVSKRAKIAAAYI